MSSKIKGIVSAHFDCQFGAAGDMLLGALLDAGVSKQAWLDEIKKIALAQDSFQISLEAAKRCSIRATKVEIDLACASGYQARPLSGKLQQLPAAASGIGFIKQADYNPTFSAGQMESSHGRHLDEILDIIKNSTITESAKDLASNIFQRLARAEAQVHGISPCQVHFHEVGALDAIVDIIGFSIAFDLAEIEQVSCTALPLGSGVIETEHGIFPVPAPAVLKLMEEAKAPAANISIPFECLTPTGAAILCQICQRWGAAPAFSEISASGYGAGSKDPQEWPNVARVILGSTARPADAARFDTEIISVIEANIDDQTPQALVFAVDKILAAGALDVMVIPAMMKKGRSGHLLSVLCLPEDERKFQEMIITETSSIGARSKQMSRLVAKRQFTSVSMENGSRISIKLACDQAGLIVNVQPEFDDLANYAMMEEISIKEAQSRAIYAFKHRPVDGERRCNASPGNCQSAKAPIGERDD